MNKLLFFLPLFLLPFVSSYDTSFYTNCTPDISVSNVANLDLTKNLTQTFVPILSSNLPISKVGFSISTASCPVGNISFYLYSLYDWGMGWAVNTSNLLANGTYQGSISIGFSLLVLNITSINLTNGSRYAFVVQSKECSVQLAGLQADYIPQIYQDYGTDAVFRDGFAFSPNVTSRASFNDTYFVFLNSSYSYVYGTMINSCPVNSNSGGSSSLPIIIPPVSEVYDLILSGGSFSQVLTAWNPKVAPQLKLNVTRIFSAEHLETLPFDIKQFFVLFFNYLFRETGTGSLVPMEVNV